MKIQHLFILLSLLLACKAKSPVVSAGSSEDATPRLKAENAVMFERFIKEHDLFIAFYDRSTNRDEIPYPQLHILVDSIQDFRDMHSAMLDEIETEREKLTAGTLTSEARVRVEQRIAAHVKEADKVYQRFVAISGQIENVKFLHRMAKVDADLFLDEKRREFVKMNEKLAENQRLVDSEMSAFSGGESEEESVEFTDYAMDLWTVQNLCIETMKELSSAIRQAELTLTGSEFFEGPFIPLPKDVVRLNAALTGAKKSFSEFHTVKNQ
jgi:hypothetical protein